MNKFIGWKIRDWQNFVNINDETIIFNELKNLLKSINLDNNEWICVIDNNFLKKYLDELIFRKRNKEDMPLFGIPFAVKDNIDVLGLPTTAACPKFLYYPEKDSFVVELLKKAGAIPIGKTNLDQFATGLVGTRSGYGIVKNIFNDTMISGGSSSGSACVVARSIVPFSLGTDTAGSGRVPAGFNNIVGLKPTKGLFSTRGLVPACRLLDCVSIFSLSVEDAYLVKEILSIYDEQDEYANEDKQVNKKASFKNLQIAIPDYLEFFGDKYNENSFLKSISSLEKLGSIVNKIDFDDFYTLGKQLYQGAWVTERLVAIEDIFNKSPESINKIVYEIIGKGLNYSAKDVFQAEYYRAKLSRRINNIFKDFDILMVPTAPTIYSIEAVEKNPVELNSNLGIYTNFVNLANLCCLSLPSFFREDNLPFGFTLIAPALHDDFLCELGILWQNYFKNPFGYIEVKKK